MRELNSSEIETIGGCGVLKNILTDVFSTAGKSLDNVITGIFSQVSKDTAIGSKICGSIGNAIGGLVEDTWSKISDKNLDSIILNSITPKN